MTSVTAIYIKFSRKSGESPDTIKLRNHKLEGAFFLSFSPPPLYFGCKHGRLTFGDEKEFRKDVENTETSYHLDLAGGKV